jgi:hypothetical protein
MRFAAGAIVSVKIFISSVSRKFLAYRDQLRQHLTRHNVEVKVQEEFNDLGERAVAVRGDANGAVITTGDSNVVLRVDASGAEVIDRLIQRSLPSPLHQLPADIADFAGRGAQMERLLGVLSAPGGHVAISAIDGMGGLGKTALAVHVAHRLTARYPDGQIEVDMAGTGAVPLSPAQGLARVIRVFEPLMRLPEDVAELRPIYLHVLRGRRVLLILDNAHDGNQVAPLLPPEDCALIVTSRRQIAVGGVVRIDLDLLAPEEAVGLLGAIVGDGRATAAELSRIAELCGLLPLARRIPEADACPPPARVGEPEAVPRLRPLGENLRSWRPANEKPRASRSRDHDADQTKNERKG